jgi:hypothetical protein
VLALVVTLLMLAPKTPVRVQPPNVWLEVVSVADPLGGGLVTSWAVMLELVHVTFWPLLLVFTNVALPLSEPISTSPEATAEPPVPPTVRMPLAADAVSGSAPSAPAIAAAIARYQYLRMGQ